VNQIKSIIKEIINILVRNEIGRIVVCNMVGCLEYELLSKDVVKNFLKSVALKYKKEKKRKKGNLNSGEIIYIFEQVASKFLFCCQQSATEEDVCSIMKYNIFTRYFLKPDAFEGHDWLPLIWNPEQESNEIIIKKRIEKEISLNKEAYLGENKGFFWVTPDSDISSSLPDRIRNLLGLFHYSETHLIKIRIKANDIKKKKQARPTFIEAGGHPRFKVKSFSSSCDPSWGITTDLEKLAKNAPNIDGCRERVIEKTKIKEFKELKIEYIGKCGALPENNHENFFEKICEGLPSLELKNRLIKYIL